MARIVLFLKMISNRNEVFLLQLDAYAIVCLISAIDFVS